ncbi:MAG: hypothetical protein ACLFTT_12125 [Candidatus Hydrogenedentota bacterium]
MSEQERPGCLRIFFRWTFRLVALVVVIAALILGYIFSGAIYNRYVDFPAEAAAWEELRAQREEVSLEDGYQDYRGQCHSHSELSHDCMVPFEEILRVLKQEGRQFIAMSDHCHEGKADFSRQWAGMHDGVLFIPGYEMRDGFMPWGLPRDTVLDCGKDKDALAQEIADKGGLLFFAHTEEERRWDLPQLKGMEIYNIHTDFKDENMADLVPDLLLNLHTYPDQTFRLIFDEQTEILAHWDELNKTRDITGIAANDCHQNNGITITYTEEDTLLVRDTSPKDVAEYELNFFTRLLARVMFGALEPNKEVFRYQVDPYAYMTRYVATHVLMNELSEAAVLNALDEGRVYIGFDAIADSTGFTFLAEKDGRRAVMGETLPFDSGITLRAASPIPCRFTVLQDGEPVFNYEGRELEWQPSAPGKYRVEAHLDIRDTWIPWVYTNPLALE